MKDASDVSESPKKDKKKKKKKKKDKGPNGDDTDPGTAEPDSRTETNGDAEGNSSHTLASNDLGDTAKESVGDRQNDDDGPSKNEEKSKKPKKEKKKKKASTLDEEEPDEGATSSRHASILAKKAKSLAIAPQLELQTESAEPVDEEDAQPKPEDAGKHGLEPLPQPKPVEMDTSKPTYDTLPSWLASPIRVGPDTRTPFSEIGIHARATKFLESKGFKDAFAVQAAAIPLLLPSCKHRQGDLLVAAATGSGKTLAYALPIVRDVSQGMVTRLRALVVLPTRELVSQAYEVFQLCAGAFDGRDEKRVRIGVAVGSHQLRQEQANLVEKTERYDPEAYREALQRDREAWKVVEDEVGDPEADDARATGARKPQLGNLPDHMVEYNSKVDILLCTPGRLVDHVRHTAGFTLDYVRWLVVDEADKLLAQSFQGWLDVVMPRLRTTSAFSARDFPDSNLTGVRKLVLSATLTRDLSLLSGLQLRRPQLIVLEGADADGRKPPQTAEHTLPGLLEEFAVRVHDPNLKPLYLLELLQGDHLLSPAESTTSLGSKTEKTDEADDTTTSDEESVTSSSDSESASEAESDSDTSSSASSSSSSSSVSSPSSTAAATKTKSGLQKTVLIFTKSNESALRLSRLLTLLQPSWEGQTATLTSTQKTSHRRRILASFAAGSTRLLVASDLVARGIDLANLDNVVNYDLPAGPAAYVHRVGRTARAGRRGRAFSLVEARESGWFWGAVAKWEGIRRGRPVARVMIGAAHRPEGEGEEEERETEREREKEEPARFEEEKMAAYERALEELGREAGRVRKR